MSRAFWMPGCLVHKMDAGGFAQLKLPDTGGQVPNVVTTQLKTLAARTEHGKLLPSPKLVLGS